MLMNTLFNSVVRLLDVKNNYIIVKINIRIREKNVA